MKVCLPRSVAVLASGALFTTGLFLSSSSASEPEPTLAPAAVTDLDSDGIPDATNTAEALHAAVAQDEPVEDWSQRTETVTVDANPDGTFTRKDYGEPVRLERDGKWVDVDYDLKQQRDGSWAPKASPIDITINGGAANEAARVTFEDGRSVAVTWPESLPEPTIDGGVATYRLSKASDLVIAVTGGGVNARLRINRMPADDDPVFTMGLRTQGVDVDQTSHNSLTIKENGKTVGSSSSLRAWDAQVDAAGDSVNVVDLNADLNRTSTTGPVTNHELELKTPVGFLSDPDTVYPVMIDPDISSLSRVRDTWVLQGNTTTHGLDFRLVVGNIDTSGLSGDARSYLQFDSATLSGKEIVNAELGLYQYYAKTCSAKSMTAWPIASAWDPNIVYTNRPGWVQNSGDTTTISENRGFSASACNAGWTKVDVKKIVTAWATGKYPDHGISLAVPSSNASDPSFERRFCSFNPDTTSGACYDAARRPYLSITYNTRPVVGTAAPTVVQGTDPQVKLSATATDPDGTAPWAEFTIKRGSTVVYKGLSTSSSGSTRSVSVNGLPKGTYSITARAYDGRLYSSGTSAAASFTIADDTTDILGASFATSSPDQVGTSTLPKSSLDENGLVVPSETPVDVAGFGNIPDDADAWYATSVTLQIKNWSSLGEVSVGDPDGAPPAPAAVITAAMRSDIGVDAASIVPISEDGQVVLRNSTANPVTVVVSVAGRFSRAQPEVAAPAGPQVDPKVIFDPSGQPNETVSLTPDIEAVYTLNGTTDNRVAMQVGGVLVGHYTPHAVDDNQQALEPTITAVGGDLVVSVPVTTSTVFPITVLPTFEAASASSPTVQELYPDPETVVDDPVGEGLAPADVVEIVDGGAQAAVDDLTSPDEGEEEPLARGAAKAAPKKVPVPHWRYSDGSGVPPKNYIYDPKNRQHRSPARIEWHDYCSGLKIAGGKKLGVPDSNRFSYYDGLGGVYTSPTVSYKGPCARHDLCIQFKQAPSRWYCDDQLKADIRQNCRYFIRADLYPRRKDALEKCYMRAGTYHYWVRWTTGGKTDPGHWGHSQYTTRWPTYKYNVW